MEWEIVHRQRGGLFEAPRFDDELGLVVAEAREGGVIRLGPSGGIETVVAHRRGIGGLAIHADGGYVISGRNVGYRADRRTSGDDSTHVLLPANPEGGTTGFNDLGIDPEGRVYVGSVGFVAMEVDIDDPSLPPGAVHLIDLDGSVRTVAEDVRISNGIAFSADGRRMFLADSGRKQVLAFAVNQDGELSDRRALIDVEAGVPDGLAVDEGGDIWVAQAFAGRVGRYSPDGELVESHSIPASMVTSVCFGGHDRRTLFVTTGTPHDADADTEGMIFAAEVASRGVEIPKARTPTGSSV